METLLMAIGYITVWWFWQDFLDWVDLKLSHNPVKDS